MKQSANPLSLRVTEGRTRTILQVLSDRFDAEWAEEYGEPGYTNPVQGVVLCNWNKVPAWMCGYLKEAGYETEWSDEWVINYDTPSKAYRTSPDCYQWAPVIHCTDGGEILTPDDDASTWVDEMMNDERKALPSRITRERCRRWTLTVIRIGTAPILNRGFTRG